MQLALNILNTLFLLLFLVSLGLRGGSGGALMVVICLATLTALNLESRRSFYWLAIVLNGFVVIAGIVMGAGLLFGTTIGAEGPALALWLVIFVLLFLLLLPVLNIWYIWQNRLAAEVISKGLARTGTVEEKST